MSSRLTKPIAAAVIAVALAAATAYIFFSWQTPDQTLQSDQGSLGPASHQPPPPPTNSIPQAPGQPGASPQPPAPAPRR
jgi:hypothetical protein